MALFKKREKVILVPSLNKSVWIDGCSVSVSYIEEVTARYISLLLDMDVDTIDWKRDHLMHHVSHANDEYVLDFIDYFKKLKEKYKKFSLKTYFTPKKMNIDEKNLKVEVYGQLSSRFGEAGYKSKSVVYFINYELLAGKLLIKQFREIKEKK